MAKQTADYHGCDPYLFIVGCARSGTTLVHRIVDAHPEIAITPEMHWITRQFKSRNGLVASELVSELTGHKRFAQFEIPGKSSKPCSAQGRHSIPNLPQGLRPVWKN